jgi:hypothetical protein
MGVVHGTIWLFGQFAIGAEKIWTWLGKVFGPSGSMMDGITMIENGAWHGFLATLRFLWGGVKSLGQAFSDSWSAGGRLASGLRGKLGDAIAWVKDKVHGLPGDLSALAGKMGSAGKTLITAFIHGIENSPGLIANFGTSLFEFVKRKINDAIRAINSKVAIKIPLGPSLHLNIPTLATGGIVDRATVAMVGEGRGREAVVPLDIPLAQVDPAVRALAAFAQGKGQNFNGGRQVDARGWTIVTPSTDSRAVAREAMNMLASTALI